MDLACDITLLHNPSRVTPDKRCSVCLIFAISKTCFKETVPIVSVPGFCAPFSLPLTSLIPAACRSSHAVVGVRTSNTKDRSGRTVTRAGTGTPGVICAVLALNSYTRMSFGLVIAIATIPCRNPCFSRLYYPKLDQPEGLGLLGQLRR